MSDVFSYFYFYRMMLHLWIFYDPRFGIQGSGVKYNAHALWRNWTGDVTNWVCSYFPIKSVLIYDCLPEVDLNCHLSKDFYKVVKFDSKLCCHNKTSKCHKKLKLSQSFSQIFARGMFCSFVKQMKLFRTKPRAGGRSRWWDPPSPLDTSRRPRFVSRMTIVLSMMWWFIQEMRKPGCNGGVCFCNTENYCNDRHAVRRSGQRQFNIYIVCHDQIDICSGYQGASRVSGGAASRQVGPEVSGGGAGGQGRGGAGPGHQLWGPGDGQWRDDGHGDIMGPDTDMSQITRPVLITSAASNNHKQI